jgi:hypothetical protein
MQLLITESQITFLNTTALIIHVRFISHEILWGFLPKHFNFISSNNFIKALKKYNFPSSEGMKVDYAIPMLSVEYLNKYLWNLRPFHRSNLKIPSVSLCVCMSIPAIVVRQGFGNVYSSSRS